MHYKSIKAIATLALIGLCTTSLAQTPAFARGADVSWCTEMESTGKQFYNAAGEPTEMMALLRQCGMNAVRLRVWVNPERAYGAWSDKADVLAKARRAHAQGLAVMIDFHYSDFFADPGRQDMPSAWSTFSLAQLKDAVAAHTIDVLSTLKAEGIEPAWVQVGNETRSGMMWDAGKIDWAKQGAGVWNGYVQLSNAGYEAVKNVLPQTQVIVHIDRGQEDNAWFFKAFKQYGGKFDMIGLSHYPGSNWRSENAKTAANVQALATQFSVPVIIAETGYDASDEALAAEVMADLMTRLKGASACRGVFYWEPEVYGWWKPAYYTTLGWNAYGKGAFTSQGRPSAALAPFFDADGISLTPNPSSPQGEWSTYDLAGRCAGPSSRGVLIERAGATTRKVIKR